MSPKPRTSKRKRVKKGSRLPHAEAAGIDLPKLRDYVLDPDHWDNDGKAVAFARKLGIHRKDWRYLHDQILEKLPGSDVTRINLSSPERVEFTVSILIRGRNDETREVVTGWGVDALKEPWLITAYVGRKHRS